MQITQELWDKAVEFHGHACPGLAIGMRLAAEAASFLGLTGRSHDEETVCIAETDACGVDAVQMLLGCSLGKGNLLLRLRGKNAMTFVHRPTRRACRVVWQQPNLPASLGQDERISLFLSEAGRAYCTLSELEAPCLPKAEMSKSEPCARCGESTAEHMLRRVDGQNFCIDCAAAARPGAARIIP